MTPFLAKKHKLLDFWRQLSLDHSIVLDTISHIDKILPLSKQTAFQLNQQTDQMWVTGEISISPIWILYFPDFNSMYAFAAKAI